MQGLESFVAERIALRGQAPCPSMERRQTARHTATRAGQSRQAALDRFGFATRPRQAAPVTSIPPPVDESAAVATSHGA